MTTENDIAQAQEQVANEWHVFRQMSIFKRIMDAAVNREAAAIEMLVQNTDPALDPDIRADIQRARDMIDWYGNMEQVYMTFYEPERFEPETYDEQY